jgi:hypothetical protein
MTITALPPAPNPSDPANFDSLAYTFVAALGSMVTEFNADAATLNATSITIAADAAAAAASAATAELAKLAAQGAANFVGDYSAGTTYSQGQCVLSSSVRYVSRVNGNVGNTPASSPTQWLNITATGTVTSVAAGTGMSFTSITTTGSVAIDKATDTHIRAGTSNKVLTSDTVKSAWAPVSLGGSIASGNLTIDFTTGLCFSGTFAANGGGTVTLANPTTEVVGQSGLILLTQAATTAKALAIDTQYVWVGGTPSPTISATLASRNAYAYYVAASGVILLQYLGSY